MSEDRLRAPRALHSVGGFFLLLIAVPAMVAFSGRADDGAPARAARAAATGTVAPAGAAAVVPAGAGTVAPAVVVAPARQQPLFDPTADPAVDLKAAVAEASQSGRRIMLDVGGNWCPWCLLLHRYLHDDPDLKAFVEQNYVWVRVNYGPKNKNEKFLSQYPAIKGYPHLFVLAGDGELLHSQDTSLLEQGNSYSNEKMWAFLREWTTATAEAASGG